MLVGIPYLTNKYILYKCLKNLYGLDILIINNGIDNLDGLKSEKIRVINTLKDENNIHSVAESWNRIIYENLYYFNKDYVYILAFDVLVNKENLISLKNELLFHRGLYTVPYGFSLGLFVKNIFDYSGEFDTNFFPAYKEDIDFSRRLKLLGISDLPKKQKLINFDLISSSSTIKSNNKIRNIVSKMSYYRNNYYISKWGGKIKEESYVNPYNNSNYSSKDFDILLPLDEFKSIYSGIVKSYL